MSPWLPTIGDSVGPIKIDSHVDELCDIPPRSEGSLCLSVSHVGNDGGASCHVLSAFNLCAELEFGADVGTYDTTIAGRSPPKHMY